MGKGLAEFRKASDDFKRTWEREVALETARLDDNTILEAEHQPTYERRGQLRPTVVETPDQDLVVARESPVETTPEWVARNTSETNRSSRRNRTSRSSTAEKTRVALTSDLIQCLQS